MASRPQDLPPNLRRIIEAQVADAVAGSQPTSLEGDLPPNLRRILEARRLAAESPDEEGFLERINRFGENVFGDPELSIEDPTLAEEFRAGLQQFQAIGAGILDPIIGGVQAITEIPGLFTDVDIPTDNAARFLERSRHGILRLSEEAAMDSGLTTEAVADAHLFGELVGYTAPVVASLKLARMATGIRGTDLTLARMFQVDSVAGLIFGSTLLPEEDLQQRIVNTLRESAVFGVGGLMLNGLLFSVHGMRAHAVQSREGTAALQENLERIARGERVVIPDDANLAEFIAEITSQQGFLASSPEAQALLEQFQFDQALVAGVRDLAESGLSRGFVREVGTDFAQVQQQLQRVREQFPNLKFDVVKREGLFDIHFGMQGLNNQQKAQLKREGAFAGQLIQKGDAVYVYARRGKNNRMVVRTVDGKVTTITEEGATFLPNASEEIPLPTAGQALYEDYREFVFGKMREASGMSGSIPETDLIRFMRQGQLPDLEGARMFETPGAVTHPSELGFEASQIMGRALQGQMGEFAPALDDALLQAMSLRGTIRQGGDMYHVLENTAFPQAGDVLGRFSIVRASDDRLLAGFDAPDQMWVFIEGEQVLLPEAIQFIRSGEIPDQPGTMRHIQVDVEQAASVLQEIAQTLQAGGSLPPGPVASADDFVRGFLQDGKHHGDLLGQEPVRSTEDAFDLWLRQRGLDVEAGDVEAFRQNFAQRMRSDIWDLLPEEDAQVMRRVHEEMFRLVEADELPFEAIAGGKGFHVERTPTSPEVTLRDINTGARMTFANQEVADRALRRVIRTEKDPLFNYLTPGPHGGMALTTGFDPTDGVFTFETNIAPEEMLFDLPSMSLTNVRDYMDALEEVSKIPVFSEGFGRIDEALLRQHRRLEPLANQISDIWKGIPRKRRKAVAEFWTRVEGTDLSGAALNRAARNAGLSTKEIRAFTRARQMFDIGAEQLGLPESRFISNYYSRIRAMYEEGLSQTEMLRRLADDQVFHKEFQFWAEMTRSGDLPQVELDPEIVMHKYFKALTYKQEIAPLETRFRRMVNTRIRDLSPEQQQQILRRSLPETDVNSFVLPPPVRAFAKEYINSIRGDLNPGFKSARQHFLRLTRGLGMEVDPRIVDELHSTYLSMQYGAAIGIRLALMNRNAVQNIWMMYPRVGGKHAGRSLEMAMSIEGFREPLEAGAIRSTSAATPFYDAIFNNWFGPNVARGSGPVSNAAAATLRWAIRAGRVTRKTAEKFLIPYGSGDQVNRSWAYWWQKMHTQEHLERFQAGRIDWDEFLEVGLPFFSDTIKSQFRQRYDRLGGEAALRYIGKQAADEAHFLYGAASSPPWMQRPFMRLFGVFGQWPLWAKQMYWNRMRNATPRQVAAFWGRTAAITGMFANMTIQSGISMWNWIAPAALGYAGGPALQLAILARDVIDRPMDQKAAALKRLGAEAGGLLIPGQLFYNEMTTALDQDDPRRSALLLTLGRPVDRGNFNFDVVLDPESEAFNTPPVTRIPDLEGLPPVR